MSAGLTDVGFWARLRGAFGRSRTLSPGETHSQPLGYGSSGGAAMTPDTALRLSAFWACVNLRASVIGSLPFHLHNADKTVAKDHPLHWKLHAEPNADMSAGEFYEALSASLDLWGNAYARITRNVIDDVVSIYPLNPEKVTVSRDTSGVVRYGYAANSRDVAVIPERDMLHIKGLTLDGFIGLSPLSYAAESLGILSEANKAASREFSNALKVGGFLKTTNQAMSEAQRNRLRAHLATFGQPENSGKWMVLEAGVEPASSVGMRVNPNDAQLLESRHFGIEEICRVFMVPPPLIGHTDKASSWASSLENLNRYFLAYSLRTRLTRIEHAIRRKLLTPEERRVLSPKFSVKALLRADTQAQSNYYKSALNDGYMSRDEVRDLEDLPAIPGGAGSAFTVQLNMTTVDNIGKPSA